MRIYVTGVYVDDQDKALKFYTEVLGFVKKTEIPLGEACWLTVVSPDNPDGTELLLEPDGHPAVGPFKQALVDDGMRSSCRVPYRLLADGAPSMVVQSYFGETGSLLDWRQHLNLPQTPPSLSSTCTGMRQDAVAVLAFSPAAGGRERSLTPGDECCL